MTKPRNRGRRRREPALCRDHEHARRRRRANVETTPASALAELRVQLERNGWFGVRLARRCGFITEDEKNAHEAVAPMFAKKVCARRVLRLTDEEIERRLAVAEQFAGGTEAETKESDHA